MDITPSRTSASLRYLAAALVTAMVVGSCGTSNPSTDAAADSSAITTSSTDTSTTASSSRAVVTTEPSAGATTSTSATEEPSTTASVSAVIDDDLHRLAPPADVASPLLLWDRSGIEALGQSGRLGRIEIENLIQVTAVPSSSPIFQIANDTSVIWQVTDDGPARLLEVPQPDSLRLEGAGVDAGGEPVMFYQHRINADPENTKATLNSYRMSDATITELDTTGGWESGAHFSHMSPLGVGRGDTAVALWGSEGFVWVEINDLFTGEVVFDAEELGSECFDGDEGCPNFQDAVLFDGDIIGMRAAPTGAVDGVDAFGLWWYDIETGTSDLIEAWDWDNGLWYSEDMFLYNDSVLAISLEDGEGEPLPALHFDLISGESWTEPEAGFVRPAFSS